MLRTNALKVSLALLTFSAASVNAPAVHAQAETSSKKLLLEISTREFLPPYVEKDAVAGIEVDLIKAIFRGSQYEPIFVQQPRVRMIASFEAKETDGILTQNKTASNVGCATDWYIAHQNVAKTVASRNLTIQGLLDLKQYSVLSFSGATRYLGEKFQKAVRDAKRYTESGDQGKHIALLYNNRFDVIVGDRWILALAQKRHYENTGKYLELDTHPIMTPSLYVARFHDTGICEAFNHGVRALRASGEYAEIWSGYQARLLVSSDLPHTDLPQR